MLSPAWVSAEEIVPKPPGFHTTKKSVDLQDSEYHFRVETDPEKKKVHIFYLPPDGMERAPNPKPPEELRLELRNSEGTIQEIRLRAAPTQTALENPYYSGALHPNQASFTGLQLKFGIKAPKGLRSKTKGSKTPIQGQVQLQQNSERILQWSESRD
jgi:hypothetical protein